MVLLSTDVVDHLDSKDLLQDMHSKAMAATAEEEDLQAEAPTAARRPQDGSRKALAASR